MFDCICKFCGGHFESKQPSTTVCEECKNRPCEICGKSFVHVWPYDQKCCSQECRKVLINDPEHQAAAVAKRDETVKMRYGVSNVSKMQSSREKISRHRKDRQAYLEELAEIKEQERASRAETNYSIKNCIICGKEFKSYNNKLICPDTHYRECRVCGQPFEIKSSSVNERETCSNLCRRILLQETLSSKTRVCAACGKEFNPTGSNSKFCSGPHYSKCAVCGKQFEINVQSGNYPDYISQTCSTKCRIILSKYHNIEKYGVEHPHQLEDVQHHIFLYYDILKG